MGHRRTGHPLDTDHHLDTVTQGGHPCFQVPMTTTRLICRDMALRMLLHMGHLMVLRMEVNIALVYWEVDQVY